ncbi:MAG: imidazoleglycerol-phosphate dehydratase [Candidatus Omnitrophica bacterium]|nr:imidazoleglycerol-phosphate dehydratase [Candidatus Omnitrophota bacterium]
MPDRKAKLERKSKETQISLSLNIDGKGKARIKTNIGILDHMLELFTFHGFFDLDLNVKKSDLKIDIHHTNEDIGIVLGKGFAAALGEKKSGIKRFGDGFALMESTLARSVIDICGRSHLKLEIPNEKSIKGEGGYTITHFEHFLESFAKGIGATINLKIENPSIDIHTTLESAFKSLGLALDNATQIDSRRKGATPSTKGIID